MYLSCSCGSVCKQAPSRIARHQAINDVIARAITATGVPVTKEPVGLARLDGKRPDGLTLIPWQGGKPLTWDVTVVSTLADSYLHSPSHSAGIAAEVACDSDKKESMYSTLPSDYIFQPVALETFGPFICSELPKRGWSTVEFFICRSTRDLVSILAPLDDTSTQSSSWIPTVSLTKTRTSSRR